MRKGRPAGTFSTGRKCRVTAPAMIAAASWQCQHSTGRSPLRRRLFAHLPPLRTCLLHTHRLVARRHLPLARDLVRVARQRLVFRLDSYCKRHYALFGEAIRLIDDEMMPLLRQCSLAGHAEYKTSNPLFDAHKCAPVLSLPPAPAPTLPAATWHAAEEEPPHHTHTHTHTRTQMQAACGHGD